MAEIAELLPLHHRDEETLDDKMEEIAKRIADQILAGERPDAIQIQAFKVLSSYLVPTRKLGRAEDEDESPSNFTRFRERLEEVK